MVIIMLIRIRIRNDRTYESAGPAQSSSLGLYQPERLATIPLAAPPLRVALHASRSYAMVFSSSGRVEVHPPLLQRLTAN